MRKLQAKYPAALYSYFRVTNHSAAYKSFVADPKKKVFFIHHEKLNPENIEHQLAKLQTDIDQLTSRQVQEAQFLRWRRSEYRILKHYCELKQKKQITDEDKHAYLAAQYALYGELDKKLFTSILAFLHTKAVERQQRTVWQELAASVDVSPGKTSLPVPSKKVFDLYSRTFCESAAPLCAALSGIKDKKSYTSEEIKHYFQEALKAIGADKHGWRVIRIRSGNNIVVSKFKKKILLPYSFSPKSALRLRQIIAHEVGAHVQRGLNHEEREYNGYDDAEEGLAILLEQLVDDHFVHKRAMRYFAICLAIGVDGQQRNFKEVYEILAKAYDIIGYGKVSSAKAAFSETTRAYRGGLPSERGVVYIKDKIYLEGNLKVWDSLNKKQLSTDEFRQLFNGHDTIAREA